VGDFIALTTHRGGYRVLLLHPAEALQPASANALLKTLEEPPPRTLIALVSDRPARLLATLRSRCRRLPLRTPPRAERSRGCASRAWPQPEAALDAAGGAPLLARDLAEPEEAELRRPARGRARQARRRRRAAVRGSGRSRHARARDLVDADLGPRPGARAPGRRRAPPREHAAAFRPARRGADLDALFDLDRELAEARRLAPHPLNRAPADRAPAHGLQSGHLRHAAMTETAAYPTSHAPGVFTLVIRSKAALYAAWIPLLKGGGIFLPSSAATRWARRS
jgi:DNA polymerase-3 subunit delta'